jgi:hypothetical protein
MATKSADQRLEEMQDRIDRLQAKAQASGAGAKDSIKSQLDALREQEASARAALKEAHDVKTREADKRAAAADDKLRQLETRARNAEYALTAELAQDKQTFIDAMNADLDDFEELLHRLDEQAAAKTGSAREQAEADVGELRGSMNTVVERLAEVREASGDRWRERKKDVTAARVELERKVDEALQRTFR